MVEPGKEAASISDGGELEKIDDEYLQWLNGCASDLLSLKVTGRLEAGSHECSARGREAQ